MTIKYSHVPLEHFMALPLHHARPISHVLLKGDILGSLSSLMRPLPGSCHL